MTVIMALRIHGPIAVEPLAAKLGTTAIQLDRRLWELENEGLADHPDCWDGTWSATEAGRACADRHEVGVGAVARDGAKECVGRTS